ncbi:MULTISPECIES: hypothetical protein, partial [unclassified Caballeronia]|uniref:hypothetical protein n=1 Tax=unclassified Caballeronia TaxID=2646786 RepID=UPI0028630B31
RHSSRKSWELGLGLAREARPWTCVNNCTQSQTPDSSDLDDWIADYDRADTSEPAGRIAATTNPMRMTEIRNRNAHSYPRTGTAAHPIEKIHVSPDDVGDWLADYALAEARGRPSISARARLSEAS